MQKPRYVVWIHVAPYVCRYLLDNYGVADSEIKNLVDIRGDAALMSFFRSRLIKPSHAYDLRKSRRRGVGYRSERMAIAIPGSWFTRYGWALSATDECDVAKQLERRLHGMLMAYLSYHYAYTGDLAACIRSFYRRFHQTEETWPYDSIRKIWNRNYTSEQKWSLREAKIEQNTEKMLLTLSGFGTISAKGLEIYEKD